MSLIPLLEKHWELSWAEAADGLWWHHDSTPAADFYHCLTTARDGQALLCATFKSGGRFLAPKVLKAAKAFLEVNETSKGLTLLPSGDVAPFDAIALVSAQAHALFQTFDAGLNAATTVVFPVYRCEFAGDEPADIVRLIRRDFLPSLEWDRAPHPKILAAFDNPKLGMGSKSTKLKMAGLADVLSILKSMDGCHAAWLRIQNWMGEVMVIEFRDGYLCQRSGRAEMAVVDGEAAAERVQDFCVMGV